MKRTGNLIEKIADKENLYLAFYKAIKGKRQKQEVLEYQKNLDENISQLQKQILSGNVEVGNYHYFKIYDPKERTICAATFPERVLHHALMNICHPYFERQLIFDTYATRLDKGIYRALDKAKKAMKKYRYVAKFDFKKFFDSVSHDVLKQQLKTVFKDKQLLSIFEKIIDSYHSDKNNKGIPIGNLTSQYFANFYLSRFDHFAKETLKIPVYIRYMDDILVFENDVNTMKNIVKEFIAKAEEFSMIFKQHQIKPSHCGVTFLGYKLFPHKILLSKTGRKRFVKKIITANTKLHDMTISEKEYQRTAVPLVAFVKYAYTKRLRKTHVNLTNTDTQ
jgi:retron-type reverse transcriptase